MSILDNKLEIPAKIIEEKINKFNERQNLDEKAVQKVFDTFTDNTSEEEILIKIIVLNNRYSAGLTDFYISTDKKEGKIRKGNKLPVNVTEMKDKIINKNADFVNCKTQDDAIKLVSDLKFIDSNHNEVYSFATKYCSWSFPNLEIPIVDGYVKGLLYYYNKCDKYKYYKDNDGQYKKFKQDDLKDYKFFCNVYKQFKEKYVNDYCYKDIDKFLWQYAKDLEQEHFKIKI